jgi:ribosomal protein S18 acetylase RimI-like enzyme
MEGSTSDTTVSVARRWYAGPMPLPDPIRAFWYAAEGLAETCIRTPWGVLISDARYPTIYDANHAGILESAPDLSLAEVRERLHPLLREAGATHEHIEVMDLSDPCPATDELRREQPAVTADVVMRYEGGGVEPETEARVEEITHLDESFWRMYRETRSEFGEPLGEDVIDELVARDRDVFHTAGLRIFAGSFDGEIAGFTSLIELAGTGYVDNVVTRPSFRRRGVASATVTRAVAAAHDRGLQTVFLLAEENGKPQGLYERLGFRVACRAMGFTRPLPR